MADSYSSFCFSTAAWSSSLYFSAAAAAVASSSCLFASSSYFYYTAASASYFYFSAASAASASSYLYLTSSILYFSASAALSSSALLASASYFWASFSDLDSIVVEAIASSIYLLLLLELRLKFLKADAILLDIFSLIFFSSSATRAALLSAAPSDFWASLFSQSSLFSSSLCLLVLGASLDGVYTSGD